MNKIIELFENIIIKPIDRVLLNTIKYGKVMEEFLTEYREKIIKIERQHDLHMSHLDKLEKEGEDE